MRPTERHPNKLALSSNTNKTLSLSLVFNSIKKQLADSGIKRAQARTKFGPLT